MVLVCDAHIPYLVEAVRMNWPQVQVCPLEPEQIDALAVREADVLVVRTRTQVNKILLEGSRVRLVCTATIGFDHIDTAYCEAQGIHWASCPGCNAKAVCEYIEEAIEEVISHFPFPISPFSTIGIVGVGHVGSLVAGMAKRRGMNILLNDPPKGIGVSLDEIAEKADIITFHTPLDSSTFHLCDEAFLKRCKPGALIINAARGGVVDEKALLESGHPYILDTWENEPAIDRKVLNGAFRASMHIAGYSQEGKWNASQMCLNRIAEELQLPAVSLPLLPPKKVQEKNWLETITEVLKAYPERFETLRKNYPLR